MDKTVIKIKFKIFCNAHFCFDVLRALLKASTARKVVSYLIQTVL